MQIEISNETQQLLHAAMAWGHFESADALIAAMAKHVVNGELAEMPSHTDVESLAKNQGVGPISDFRDLKAEFWPADAKVDDFLSEIRDRRHHDTPRGR